MTNRSLDVFATNEAIYGHVLIFWDVRFKFIHPFLVLFVESFSFCTSNWETISLSSSWSLSLSSLSTNNNLSQISKWQIMRFEWRSRSDKQMFLIEADPLLCRGSFGTLWRMRNPDEKNFSIYKKNNSLESVIVWIS